MNFTETLKLALAAIWAHKLRSFLTLLGMIIGVGAVIVMVAIGNGAVADQANTVSVGAPGSERRS